MYILYFTFSNFASPKQHASNRQSNSGFFIRVNDLNIPKHIVTSQLPKHIPPNPADSKLATSDFYHLDSIDAPTVIESLVQIGLKCAIDGDNNIMDPWKPMDETKKTLSRRRNNKVSADPQGWALPHGKEILIWSSKFTHNMYGSGLPVVKARGIVNTSPLKLVELLLDSNRVKEYNKMSLGRDDVYVFDVGPSGPGEECKVIRSLSKAPLVKNPLELISLMCSRELKVDQSGMVGNLRGYLVVTRAVVEDEIRKEGQKNEKTSRSEMLLGVNLVRYIDNDKEESCSRAEFTTITQMYSPLMPMVVAKRIGLSSAGNFIRDIQAIFF